MVIQIDYLHHLPPNYKKALENLNENLKNSLTVDAKDTHLFIFAEKYTLIPEIWKYWFQLIGNDNILKHYDYIQSKSQDANIIFNSQEEEWPNLFTSSKYIQATENPYEKRLKEAELLISLPHSKLSFAYEIFQQFQGSIVSKNMREMYKAACELYKQIEAMDMNDGKKLVKLFMQIKNDEFIVKNIKCRLTKSPWCQSLWKANIKYLETKDNPKNLLQVLSRYCRLFLEDKKMKEKYQEKIEKMSENCDFEISEFWRDSIKFEFQFNSIEAAKNLLQKAFEATMKNKLKFFDEIYDFFEKLCEFDLCKVTQNMKDQYLKENPGEYEFNFNRVLKQATFENPMNQTLPFSLPMIRYIFENLNHCHIQKLYQTCKYFYFHYRLILIEKIEVNGNMINSCTPNLKYHNYTVILSPNNFDWKKMGKNIWLTSSLSINSITNPEIVKNLCSKIVKNNLKYLYIKSTNISANDFDILTKSGTIEYFYFGGASTIRDENNAISVGQALAKLPNILYLTINVCYLPPESCANLMSLKFKNKIKLFDFSCQGNLNVDLFFDFIYKNLAPNAHLNLHFENRNYKPIMSGKIAAWNPENEKPIYTSHSTPLT